MEEEKAVEVLDQKIREMEREIALQRQLTGGYIYYMYILYILYITHINVMNKDLSCIFQNSLVYILYHVRFLS